MLRFALGRLLQAIPVLLIVISLTFLLVHSAPGGPFSADKAVPPEVIKALRPSTISINHCGSSMSAISAMYCAATLARRLNTRVAASMN